MTIMSEEARKQKIESALESHPSDGERQHLPWQNSYVDASVVNLPLDAVLLNPGSHRIRAQIESHPDRDLIRADPHSERSQETVGDILRATDGFADLKTNLTQEGQREAGVVTRAGILINGNTRTVALRDLDQHYVRAAVLPADATQEELDQLELRLQMRREFRQDYTFTNEILFVEDLLTRYHRTAKEIALGLGWAAADEPTEVRRGTQRVQQAQQLLSLIRNVQQMSQATLPLTFFDDKRQALIEINNAYQELLPTNPQGAESLREARLLAMFAGLGYRELRKIDTNFVSDHLLPAMDSDPLLRDEVLAHVDPPGETDLPGLDIVDTGGSDDSPSLTPLLAALTRNATGEVLELQAGEGPISLDREFVVDALRTSIEVAVEEADADRRAGGRLDVPAKLLKDALKALTRSTRALNEVREQVGFQLASFKDVLNSVRRSVDALQATVDDAEGRRDSTSD